jgi:hypothetical protein
MRRSDGQIKVCKLFLPVISAGTQAREEGYFRREWNLAVGRTLDMADGIAFLLPVVIEATSDADARVPEKFREVQWTRLPGGETPASFVERVRGLMSRSAGPASDKPANYLGISWGGFMGGIIPAILTLDWPAESADIAGLKQRNGQSETHCAYSSRLAPVTRLTSRPALEAISSWHDPDLGSDRRIEALGERCHACPWLGA